MNPDCSIILPAYNEGTGLIQVVDEISTVLRKTSLSFEIIITDDGSTDNTWQVINDIREKHTEVKALRFARNFGHQLAVHAAIKATSGDMVAIMDSDGQDPAELLPEMFEKIKTEGYDVVNCIRKKRKESSLKRFCYFTFYRIYSRMVPFDMALDSGDFSAFNRKIANIIANISQHTPFIRGMRAWAGGRQYNLEYDRHRRQSGEPKYGFTKLVLLAIDGITSFSKVPLRASIIIGIFISAASILYAGGVLLQKTLGLLDPSTPRGWTTLACMVSFMGGMILTVLGIIGEYLCHIFDAVRGMPPYRINEQLGFDSPA